MGPRFNEGPRVVAKCVRYNDVFFHIFCYNLGRECSIVRDIEVNKLDILQLKIGIKYLCSVREVKGR